MRWVSLLVLLAASNASGQTLVDGTGEAIPKERLQEVMRLTADKFRDPESTKFRRLASRADHSIICGEVNGKNAYGAYTGYKRFQVVAQMDPIIMPEGNDPLRRMYEIALESCSKK